MCAAFFEHATKLIATDAARIAHSMPVGAKASLPHIIPTTVNSAFSLELYLKCLRIIEGNPAGNTHDLECIFDKLLPESKKAIRKYFREELNRKPIVIQLRAAGYSNRKLQFRFILRNAKDAFEQWRYYFERKRKTKSYNAEAIRHSVRRVIIERHPKWQVDLDSLYT